MDVPNNNPVDKIQAVNPLTTSIINALEEDDRLSVTTLIRAYKLPSGAVNYEAVLSIPVNDRIPALLKLKGGVERIHKVVGGAVQVAMEALTLKQSLSPGQIMELVDTILDSSHEDNLGVEDVVLFLQQLVRGQTEKLFNQIDITKFMYMFERYRQERYKNLINIREEQDANYKKMGRDDSVSRIRKDKDMDADTFFSLMQTYNSGHDTNPEGNS
jgi:hypothetical protein